MKGIPKFIHHLFTGTRERMMQYLELIDRFEYEIVLRKIVYVNIIPVQSVNKRRKKHRLDCNHVINRLFRNDKDCGRAVFLIF